MAKQKKKKKKTFFFSAYTKSFIYFGQVSGAHFSTYY